MELGSLKRTEKRVSKIEVQQLEVVTLPSPTLGTFLVAPLDWYDLN